MTGLLMAPGGLTVRPAHNLTRQRPRQDCGQHWVHVNVANVTFPNGSGSARPGPALRVRRGNWSLGASPPFTIHLSPSDCLCIYLSLYSLRGVCVRSGSFKHCSKSIALIKRRHFTEMRKTKTKQKEEKLNTSCFEE